MLSPLPIESAVTSTSPSKVLENTTISPASMSPKEFFSYVQSTYLVDETRPDRFISFPSIGNHRSSPDVVRLNRSLESWIQSDLAESRTLITLPIDCKLIAENIVEALKSEIWGNLDAVKIYLTIGRPSVLQSIAAIRNSTDPASLVNLESFESLYKASHSVEGSPLFDSLPNLETLSDLLSSYSFFIDVIISVTENEDSEQQNMLYVEVSCGSGDAIQSPGVAALVVPAMGAADLEDAKK